MAYFSNGTEGEMYRERWCFRCEFLPQSDDADCPIWSAHFFYVHDRQKNPAVKDILDMLIPMKPVQFKDGLTIDCAAECAFFRHRTEPLPFGEQPA